MNTRILIVSATPFEIKPLFKLNTKKISNNYYQLEYSNTMVIDVLVTGVGIAAMTYSLTKFLNKNQVNFVILIGISGSYMSSIKLGEVVNVMSERFADLGVIGTNDFTDLFEMNLSDSNGFPFENGILNNYTLINNKVVNALRSVSANTVNTIRQEIFPHIQKDSDIESMEGAAFFYTCMQEKVPFIQIRGISNYVGEQDKSKWDIELATNNLNAIIFELLSELK